MTVNYIRKMRNKGRVTEPRSLLEESNLAGGQCLTFHCHKKPRARGVHLHFLEQTPKFELRQLKDLLIS